KAYLRGANLQKANLGGANLQEANLGGANLQEANLGRANLQKANLGGANLQKANLGGANLQEANLGGANLQNTFYTNESTLGATCQKLYLTIFINYPCLTIFPENFNPKAAGMKLIKELQDIPKDTP
ncbi:MAG: pentapeptide repeat-containing protein, partial [Moorea sp. SIO2I5]|nr:pentapeptide repeat-containing protein [Moorena sp. SIO2I5]